MLVLKYNKGRLLLKKEVLLFLSSIMYFNVQTHGLSLNIEGVNHQTQTLSLNIEIKIINIMIKISNIITAANSISGALIN